MARCIFSNYVWDVTLLRGQSSNPPSTKKEEGSEEKASRLPLIWQMLLGVPCLLSDLLVLCLVALHS